MEISDINLKEVLSLTLDSKINYTKKHNYDLLIKTNWNNVSKYHFKDFEAQFQDNSQPYLKVLGFLRVLYAFEMLRDYDNVMWIDADAIITNSNYTIQDITTEEHCFFVSYDWAWTKSFNTGNFISADVASGFQKFILDITFRVTMRGLITKTPYYNLLIIHTPINNYYIKLLLYFKIK